MSKFLPDEPRLFATTLRVRSHGHAKQFDVAVYGKPDAWQTVANTLDAAVELFEALTKLRAACAAHPEMQGRQYVDLGIEVNDALAKAQRNTVLTRMAPVDASTLTSQEGK